MRTRKLFINSGFRLIYIGMIGSLIVTKSAFFAGT